MKKVIIEKLEDGNYRVDMNRKKFPTSVYDKDAYCDAMIDIEKYFFGDVVIYYGGER